jgi:hypothetical protein
MAPQHEFSPFRAGRSAAWDIQDLSGKKTRHGTAHSPRIVPMYRFKTWNSLFFSWSAYDMKNRKIQTLDQT